VSGVVAERRAEANAATALLKDMLSAGSARGADFLFRPASRARFTPVATLFLPSKGIADGGGVQLPLTRPVQDLSYF
jgi:hypothetical protein